MCRQLAPNSKSEEGLTWCSNKNVRQKGGGFGVGAGWRTSAQLWRGSVKSIELGWTGQRSAFAVFAVGVAEQFRESVRRLVYPRVLSHLHMSPTRAAGMSFVPKPKTRRRRWIMYVAHRCLHTIRKLRFLLRLCFAFGVWSERLTD